MSDTVRYEVGDHVAVVTLHRPERLNAMTTELLQALLGSLESAAIDNDVRAVIVTGAGRAFCAGGDVNFMAELVERGDSEEFARLLGAAYARTGRYIIMSGLAMLPYALVNLFASASLASGRVRLAVASIANPLMDSWLAVSAPATTPTDAE